MDIREITFEEILPYWKILWETYVNEGCKISRVNLWSQKNYCYKSLDYLSNDGILKVLKPIYIACFINNEIVGVESGYKTNIDYYRIRGLWVDEDYRRKGIATELVKWFEKKSKERYIWTIPRENSLGFYLKNGFIVTGRVKSIYGENYFAVKERK
jgi:ribosomal protein S18 acetylase RimI-like enzyme